MSVTKKVSFSAILAAVSFIILLMGCVLETVTFSVAAIASLCIVVAVIELGYLYSAMIYAAVSLISFFLLPVKDPLLYYTAFFGFYPIIKALTERLNKAMAYIIKGAVFTASFFAVLFLGIKLIAPEVKLETYLVIIGYAVLLAVFYAFDYALTKLILSYNSRIRKRLGIDKLLK